jgi:hypothetical protein
MNQNGHLQGEQVAGACDIESAERLNAIKALGDSIAMHAQTLEDLYWLLRISVS